MKLTTKAKIKHWRCRLYAEYRYDALYSLDDGETWEVVTVGALRPDKEFRIVAETRAREQIKVEVEFQWQ